MIHPGPSGYCDLQLIGHDHVGTLYESGDTKYHERISFAAYAMAELEGSMITASVASARSRY
ncbi:MAG: exo-alpha-sialidase [Microlunatus sp.]|nr:exo-alpha-sialidase [Microlunatus sp.]